MKKKGRREPRRLPRAFVKAAVPGNASPPERPLFFLRVLFDLGGMCLGGTAICITGVRRGRLGRNSGSLHRRRLCSKFD